MIHGWKNSEKKTLDPVYENRTAAVVWFLTDCLVRYVLCLIFMFSSLDSRKKRNQNSHELEVPPLLLCRLSPYLVATTRGTLTRRVGTLTFLHLTTDAVQLLLCDTFEHTEHDRKTLRMRGTAVCLKAAHCCTCCSWFELLPQYVYGEVGTLKPYRPRLQQDVVTVGNCCDTLGYYCLYSAALFTPLCLGVVFCTQQSSSCCRKVEELKP